MSSKKTSVAGTSSNNTTTTPLHMRQPSPGTTLSFAKYTASLPANNEFDCCDKDELLVRLHKFYLANSEKEKQEMKKGIAEKEARHNSEMIALRAKMIQIEKKAVKGADLAISERKYLEDENLTLRAEIEELHQRNECLAVTANRYRTMNAPAAIKDLEDENEGLLKQIQELETQVAGLDARNADWESEYEDLRDNKESSDPVVGAWKTKVEELTVEVEVLEAEVASLQSLNEDLLASNEKWHDDIELAKTTIAEQKSVINQQNANIAMHQQHYDDMKEDEREMRSAIQGSVEVMRLLKKKLVDANDRVTDLEAEVKKCNAKIKQQEVTVDQAKKHCLSLEEATKEQRAMSDEMKGTISEQQTKLETQEATIKTQNAAIVTHTATIDRQRQQLEQNRDMVEAKAAHIDELNGKIESKNQEI